MRTKTILLVRDTIFMLYRRPIDGKYRPTFPLPMLIFPSVTRDPSWHLETVMRFTRHRFRRPFPGPPLQLTKVPRTW